MDPLETKLIFQGTIFHFHDYGRKGIYKNALFNYQYIYISWTTRVVPPPLKWLKVKVIAYKTRDDCAASCGHNYWEGGQPNV